MFLSADFELNESENKMEILKITNWNNITMDENKFNNNENENNTQNIILKNKIFRLSDNLINLRCLSVICQVTLLMSGESNFFIFSRCTEKLNNQTIVCYISKELESARKFISFAVLEEKEDEKFIIKNIKKQEIPKQENYIKALDISEIKFIFVDNGDNKCYIFLVEQEQNSNLFIGADFYEPISFNSNLMFAVSGDLISLKKLEIKQGFRNSYINMRNNYRNTAKVQACNCCTIF